MKPLTHLPSWLKNKYIISFGVFTAILLFFDKNDLFTQWSRQKQLKELEESKQYYTNHIESERKILRLLKSDPSTLEKFAREKYLMKRDNEDLYLVPEIKD